MTTEDCLFHQVPPVAGARWVLPQLVGEVRYISRNRAECLRLTSWGRDIEVLVAVLRLRLLALDGISSSEGAGSTRSIAAVAADARGCGNAGAGQSSPSASPWRRPAHRVLSAPPGVPRAGRPVPGFLRGGVLIEEAANLADMRGEPGRCPGTHPVG